MIDRILEWLNDTGRTSVVSVGAAINGFILDKFGCMFADGEITMVLLEMFLKNVSFLVSIILGVLSIVTWSQKQRDRKKK